MLDSDMSDAALVEAGAESLKLLASYLEYCNIMEEVEASFGNGRHIDEIQRRVVISDRQWRASLLRLGSSNAYTEAGILAKCHAMQGYFSEYVTEGLEATTLMKSLVHDIMRWLAAPDC
jgi:hypothetical protein